MTKRLLLLALFAFPAFAADDPRAQIDLLQAALNICQQQTQDANAAALQRMAPLVAQNAALQKRVAELEEAAKKAEKK